MSEQPQTSTSQALTVSANSQPSASAQVTARADEHPELAVGAAFAGGLLLALILKRLAK